MVTLSDFVKIFPDIKNGGFRYKILGEKSPLRKFLPVGKMGTTLELED